MFKKQGQYFYSPSDLIRFMESPFASWMDRFSAECVGPSPEKDSPDPLMDVLAEKGIEHEKKLELEFIQQGKSLIHINGESVEKEYQKTLLHMHSGVDVIAQARLELDQFCGYADLINKSGHFGLESENEDIKLHVWSFDEAMQGLYGGYFNSAASIIALQWLEKYRQEAALC